MNPSSDLGVTPSPREGISSCDSEEKAHVGPLFLLSPVEPGLDISSLKFPCFNLMRTEDFSVDGFKFVPLVVESSGVEGIAGASLGSGLLVFEGVADPLVSLSDGGRIVRAGVTVPSRPWSQGLGN